MKDDMASGIGLIEGNEHANSNGRAVAQTISSCNLPRSNERESLLRVVGVAT
jgi:hypothetical protein